MLFSPIAFGGVDGAQIKKEITITVFFQSVFQRKSQAVFYIYYIFKLCIFLSINICSTLFFNYKKRR